MRDIMPQQPPTPEELWEQYKDDKNFWDQTAIHASGMTIEEYLHANVFTCVTLDEIQAQYRSLNNRAGPAGIQITVTGGSPIKRDLIGKAEACPVWSAFSEFIDNILDNYQESFQEITAAVAAGNRPSPDLEVIFEFTNINETIGAHVPNNGMLLITENSGGVPKSKWLALTQVGNTQWNQASEPVGTWGNGSKVALAALGRWNIFQTYHISENVDYRGLIPVQMEFGAEANAHPCGGMRTGNPGHDKMLPSNYYHEENDYWNVVVNMAQSGYCMNNPGSSAITIQRLSGKLLECISDSNEYRTVIEMLAKVFNYKIRKLSSITNSNISIRLKNTRLAGDQYDDVDITTLNPPGTSGDWSEDRKLFTFMPNAKPIHHTCTLRLPNTTDLEMEVLVGMPLYNISDDRGFSMWGNGRLFHEGFRSFETPSSYFSWGEGETVQTGRVRGFVKLTSTDPSCIPWKGPVKWEFNHLSPYSGLVIDVLSSIITRYVKVSNELSPAGLVPDVAGGPKFLRYFHER